MLIGLSGKAGSGKDTVAEILTFYGFKRVSFAAKVREVASDLFRIPLHVLSDRTTKDTPISSLGLSPRQILQGIGQGMRNIDPNVWVNYVLNSENITANDIVITDVRYQNEAILIENMGGFLWRVARPCAGLSGAAGEHPSEVDLDDWAFKVSILNDSTLSNLRERVVMAMGNCRKIDEEDKDT